MFMEQAQLACRLKFSGLSWRGSRKVVALDVESGVVFNIVTVVVVMIVQVQVCTARLSGGSS